MRKIIFKQIKIIFLPIIAVTFGIAFYFFYHSKEFYAGQSIAKEFAVQKQLSSDLTCITGVRSWTKRGNYNLSCFLFLPKNEFKSALMNNYKSARFILVRYNDKCSLNTFEVGTTTNSNAGNCLTNDTINDAKFVSPQ